MFDLFEPLPGYDGNDSCIGCVHFLDDSVPWVSDCDLCSRNYDDPCGDGTNEAKPPRAIREG